jgi:hypothetical protein
MYKHVNFFCIIKIAAEAPLYKIIIAVFYFIFDWKNFQTFFNLMSIHLFFYLMTPFKPILILMCSLINWLYCLDQQFSFELIQNCKVLVLIILCFNLLFKVTFCIFSSSFQYSYSFFISFELKCIFHLQFFVFNLSLLINF